MISHEKEKMICIIEAIQSLESDNIKSIQIRWKTNEQGTAYPNINVVYYKKEE